MTESQANTEKRAWVSDIDFIQTWENASNKQDVADALGMQLASVEQRARNMRKLGVQLKVFPSQRVGAKGPEYWARMEQLRAQLSDSDQ